MVPYCKQKGKRKMIITGTFQKILKRDEYTYRTNFLFKPDNANPASLFGGLMYVSGKIQDCPVHTPMTIDCEEREFNGNKYYELTGYSFPEYDPDRTADFLQSLCLKNFCASKIEKINRKNVNLFEMAKSQNAVQEIEALGVDTDTAYQVVTKIREIVKVKELADLLTKYGIPFSSVTSIYKHLNGYNNLDLIKKNPYVLTKYNIDFGICDCIATSFGIKQYDGYRLKALVTCAYNNCTSKGHTRVSLMQLYAEAERLEAASNRGRFTELFYIACYIDKCDLVRLFENNEWVIYSNDYYQKEKEIAENIKRITGFASKKKDLSNITRQVEAQTGITYSDKQKEAFSLLETPGVKVITGGPGTGKTTVVGGLIAAAKIMDPNVKILLCAPTATAARRAQEASGLYAQTIHKMLDVRPVGDTLIQTKDENNRLDADIIIVDEMSMVDTEIFWRLMRAVNNETIVLLVGDAAQLQSVGPGNVFHDIIRNPHVNVCGLRTIYRQGQESLIIKNSLKVVKGESDLQNGPDFEIVKCENAEELTEKLKEYTDRYYDINDPFKTRIFSTTKQKQYAASTYNINKKMQAEYIDNTYEKYLYHSRSFSKGDPVIFMKNNYTEGYCNGDVGVVRGVLAEENGKRSLRIETKDREFIISGTNVNDIDLAYAITTHKSQGGECDTAIVVLPAKPRIMLTRNLLYVAITRAKKKCIVLYERDALETAIDNNYYVKRNTGLEDRLKEAFAQG